MLVVAERVSNDGIHLILKDGLPGDIPADWMAEEPIFVTENRRHVLEQQGVNTCGLHTIFNAWAFMLNIELERTAVLTRGSLSRREPLSTFV